MFDDAADHSSGNRQNRAGRMRQILFAGHEEGFSDYDIAEMLLSMSHPRSEVELVTEQVLAHFGSLHGLLTATPKQMLAQGLNQFDNNVFDFVHEASRRLTNVEEMTRPLISDTAHLTSFLITTGLMDRPPHLVVLLLSSNNQLIKEYSFNQNETVEFIVRKTGEYILEIHASSIIIANITFKNLINPGKKDIELKERMADMARALSVAFHEHIIYASNKIWSQKYHKDIKVHSKMSKSRKLSVVADAVNEHKALEYSVELLPISNEFSDGEVFLTLRLDEHLLEESAVQASRLMVGSHKLRLLSDTELLTAILTHAANNEDVNLPTEAMCQTSSFAAILVLPASMLMKQFALDIRSVTAIKLIHVAAVRLFQAAVMDQPVLSGSDKLMRYLMASLARESVEHFRILFLDSVGRLKADEAQSRGTINHVPVYPREVVRRAHELKATYIILVHNHPSGNPSPSKDDISMTHEIEVTARLLGLKVWDHIIIGNGTSISLRDKGMLKFYS